MDQEQIFRDSYFIPIPFASIAPLEGNEVTLENENELSKEFYELEDDYAEEEISLVSITLNGAKIFLVTPKTKISSKDSFMDIVKYKYPKSWHNLFSEQLELFERINEVFETTGYNKISPKKKDIFKAFFLTPLHSVKVVIVATEPSNKEGEATGLAFGCNNGVNYTLKHIYKELYSNFKEFFDSCQPKYTWPNHGHLDEWAERGVLLLNLSLTSVLGEKGVHKDLWLGFSRRVIDYICRENESVIFMLWGGEVRNIKEFIPSRHHCLISSHPAYSGNTREPFVGCNHFYDANMILLKEKKQAIKWRLQ